MTNGLDAAASAAWSWASPTTIRSPGASPQRLHEHGAELAFTYQGEAFGKRVKPLADAVGLETAAALRCRGHRDRRCGLRRRSKRNGARIDFLVHAIAFSDKNELKGRYADTTRDNFIRTMVISCFSFTEIARARRRADAGWRRAADADLWRLGRVMPNYNVMGVAKAALEASVRYLAADYGPQGIRVNAISAGPMRTLAGAGIGDARAMFNYQQRHSPLRRTVTLEEVGGAGALSAVAALGRRHRRNPLRRFRLQHRLDAAPRRPEEEHRERRLNFAVPACGDGAI